MVINADDETSYTTQLKEGNLMYVENEYCTTVRHWPVIRPESIPNNNPVSFVKAATSGQLSSD